MKIRPATKEDIEKIKAIIDSLQVTREQAGWESRTSGLFEYTKTKEELLKALNPHFVVAELERGIRGFSLGYNNNFFRKNFADTDYKEWRYVLDNVQGDYLYADQFGVLNPDTLSAGFVVNNLVIEVIDSAREEGLGKIISFVCHKPLPNKKSLSFLARLGFKNFDEVSIDNGVVLGAYELKLGEQK